MPLYEEECQECACISPARQDNRDDDFCGCARCCAWPCAFLCCTFGEGTGALTFLWFLLVLVGTVLSVLWLVVWGSTAWYTYVVIGVCGCLLFATLFFWIYSSCQLREARKRRGDVTPGRRRNLQAQHHHQHQQPALQPAYPVGMTAVPSYNQALAHPRTNNNYHHQSNANSHMNYNNSSNNNHNNNNNQNVVITVSQPVNVVEQHYHFHHPTNPHSSQQDHYQNRGNGGGSGHDGTSVYPEHVKDPPPYTET